MGKSDLEADQETSRPGDPHAQGKSLVRFARLPKIIVGVSESEALALITVKFAEIGLRFTVVCREELGSTRECRTFG
jgi:hypothetical protein